MILSLVIDASSWTPTVSVTHVCSGEQDHHYISEGSVRLAQGLQVAVLRFASLEDGLAPLDPLDRGRGPQEDFLRPEATGAGVDDYSSWAN